MKKPDVNRLIELQKLLLQFSQVERALHRKHHGKMTHENDTEHSYNLAMSAWFLVEYFPELDKDTVIKLALVHDLVEVHAGDTYIFADEEKLASKEERETKALEQLKQDWPDFPDMLNYITDYEHRKTKESKFVYALDKVIPVITILINEGHTWRVSNMTLDRLHDHKNDKVNLSPEIQAYYVQLYELLLKIPHLLPPIKPANTSH